MLRHVLNARLQCHSPPSLDPALSNNCPQLSVQAVMDGDFLTLLFDAKLSTTTDYHAAVEQGLAANFPTFSQPTLESVLRQDNLWQKSCFECFIAKDTQANSPYLEVNLATNGEFNLYYFDSYRSPDTFPPRRLDRTNLVYGDDINFFHSRGEPVWVV